MNIFLKIIIPKALEQDVREKFDQLREEHRHLRFPPLPVVKDGDVIDIDLEEFLIQQNLTPAAMKNFIDSLIKSML